VPRDVDPEINRLDGVYLYDIDDLQSVASSHLDERGKEVELAEAMIAAEVEQYQRRLQALNVVPEIVHLQRSLEERFVKRSIVGCKASCRAFRRNRPQLSRCSRAVW
jgi:glutamyl-tRNA reductase